MEILESITVSIPWLSPLSTKSIQTTFITPFFILQYKSNTCDLFKNFEWALDWGYPPFFFELNSISTEFLALMKKVAKAPLVLDVVNIPGVQRSLERLADLLGKIQKALGEYLERERASFPRLVQYHFFVVSQCYGLCYSGCGYMFTLFRRWKRMLLLFQISITM